MSALMDPIRPHVHAEVYAPTGGLYGLAAEDAVPVEPISLVLARTTAVKIADASGAGATELSEALAAAVRRWTSGEFMVALMIGAAFSVPAPTPAMHAIALDPFTYLSATDRPAATDAPAVADDPPAFRAFKDLGAWLNAGDDQIADMLGVGRTTPYAWKREGREPRPETARRTYEYRAVMDSLRRRLEPSEFQMWLRQGNPSRRERLLAGELESLDRDVHAVVFQADAAGRPDLGWASEPTAAVASDPSARAPRRAGRRPRRARLT
jgi:hypothetical protein